MRKMKFFPICLLFLILFTAADSPTLFAAAAKTPAPAADYKGVVLYGDSIMLQLSPEGFSGNNGPKENLKNGAERHNAFVWAETMGVPGEKDPAKLKESKTLQDLAPRYFRVTLKKDEKIGSNAKKNFLAAIKKGQSPTINFAYPCTSTKIKLPVDATSLPRDTKKVFIDPFWDEFFMNRNIKKAPQTYADKYITACKDAIQQVINVVPKAKIYVSSVALFTADYPRITNPENRWLDTFAWLTNTLNGINNMSYTKLCNDGIKAYCNQKGYTFIDISKSDLNDGHGYLKDKYAHPLGCGGHLSKDGVNVYGDYICTAMGLKTAKQMYNLK